MRAALEAATRLPIEVRAQIEAVSTVGGSEPNGNGYVHGSVNGNANGNNVSPAPTMGSRHGSGDGSIAQGPSPTGVGVSPVGVGVGITTGSSNRNGYINGYGVVNGIAPNGTINPARLTH